MPSTGSNWRREDSRQQANQLDAIGEVELGGSGDNLVGCEALHVEGDVWAGQDTFCGARVSVYSACKVTTTPRGPGENKRGNGIRIEKLTSRFIRSLPGENVDRRSAIRMDNDVDETTTISTSRDGSRVSLGVSEGALRSDEGLLTTWNLDLMFGQYFSSSTI